MNELTPESGKPTALRGILSSALYADGEVAVLAMGHRSGPDAARRYYDETHALYEAHWGTTLQAGLMPGLDPDPAKSTILHVLAECNLPPNSRILDAGCGVCGPSAYIAEALPAVSVDAVTISPVQSRAAEQLIAARGLSDRIRVRVADYHALPYPDDTFDAVLFLESAGHSDDQSRLFTEMFRLLKPGGTLYIKDVFRTRGPLTATAQADLDHFELVYAYAARTIDESASAIRQAGFTVVRIDRLPLLDMTRFKASVWENPAIRERLTEYGQAHHRDYTELPILFGQIRALLT